LLWGFRLFLGLLAFSAFGIGLTRFAGFEEPAFAPVLAAGLVVCGFTVAVASTSFDSRWRIIAALALAFCFEATGVMTGFPFGHYTYTDAWWPIVHVLGHAFPLLVPLAWVMVVLGCKSVVELRSPWRVALAGFVAAVVDIPMEPLMVDSFGYWRWESQGPLFGVPLSNFLGWLLVGTVLAIMLPQPSRSRPLPAYVLAAYLTFVALAGWMHGFSWAWPLGLALSAVVLWRTRSAVARSNDSYLKD
jgi:putative membrane protein